MKTTRVDARLKETIKQAFVELLQENHDLFRELLAETLEDIAMGEAIKEGRKSKLVSREAIFKILEGKS